MSAQAEKWHWLPPHFPTQASASVCDDKGRNVAVCAPEVAPLIAAAPDLLAALKVAKSLFDANTTIGRIGDHTQINAAIAKAEGRQP